MTFKEAQAKKDAHPEPYVILEGSVYELFVMPAKQKDFINYRSDVGVFQDFISDGIAKSYSTNEQYTIGGICWENFPTRFIIRDITFEGS